MGYYTAFGFELVGEPEEVEAFENDLLEISKDNNGEIDPEVRELIDCGGTYAKLYYLADWLEELAKKHPEVLVILTGDGEETMDMWEERWKGNFHERQEVIIPPFTNPNLLTEEEKKNLKN